MIYGYILKEHTAKNPLIKLGRKKIITNNLLLEINTYGILKKKEFSKYS